MAANPPIKSYSSSGTKGAASPSWGADKRHATKAKKRKRGQSTIVIFSYHEMIFY
jgi:hypothetical protein